MATDIQPIDYGALAKSRIAQQYKNLPKFTALVEGLAKLIESGLETPCAKLFEILDIDKMEGANLDNIGEIVGQSRDVLTYTDLIFFGLIDEDEPDDPTTGSFGDDLDPGVGARFLGDADSAFANEKRTMEDPEYRLFIKARILKNYSKGTLGDLVAAVQTLTGAEQVKIDEGVMELDIGVLGTIDENTLNLIQNYDILPRPTGVKINEPYAYSILKFDGATSKVDFAATADFDIGTDDFEIRFRVKTTEQDAVILSKEDDVNSTTPSYALYIEGGILKFSYSPVDGTEVVVAGAFVADGGVKNCIVKNVSGVVSVSVDGEAVSDSENTFEAATGTADFLKVGVSELHILDRPPVITVSGSGTDTLSYGPGSWTPAEDGGKLTGEYALVDAENGVWRKYIGDRYDKGSHYLYYSYLYFHGAGGKPAYPVTGWYIQVASSGISTTGILYTATDSGYNPPASGWVMYGSAANPAPTLEYSLLLPLSGILQDLSITIAGTERGHWSMIKTQADVVTDPTTLVDLSGNGNDGTITDPVWQNNLTI